MTWNCSVPPSRWHCTTVKISISSSCHIDKKMNEYLAKAWDSSFKVLFGTGNPSWEP
uniref:Uncharacterized protein n=1 Tax=Vitis vinifera TaxID=29760 RepID=F6HWI7_VITVI